MRGGDRRRGPALAGPRHRHLRDHGQLAGAPRHHILLSAYLAEGGHRLLPGFVGDNGGGVVQAGPDHVALHSTDRRILSDAGVIPTPASVLDGHLHNDQLTIGVLS